MAAVSLKSAEVVCPGQVITDPAIGAPIVNAHKPSTTAAMLGQSCHLQGDQQKHRRWLASVTYVCTHSQIVRMTTSDRDRMKQAVVRSTPDVCHSRLDVLELSCLTTEHDQLVFMEQP